MEQRIPLHQYVISTSISWESAKVPEDLNVMNNARLQECCKIARLQVRVGKVSEEKA